MTLELILRFTGIDRVAVTFDGVEAEVAFTSPLSEDDLKELRWYVESYTSGYTADVDDRRAERVKDRLKGWGEALYKAVFHDESIASLNLSLERLDKGSRAWLPHLGVFQGGAFEDDLLAIMEVDESTWKGLRQQLEATALINVEWMVGVSVPYIKFHPTLASMLWLELSEDTQQKLLSRHRQRYYYVSDYLYRGDRQNSNAARLVARRELSNLMFAVQGSISAKEEWAIEFVNNVSKFLDDFGLKRDRSTLSQQSESLSAIVI